MVDYLYSIARQKDHPQASEAQSYIDKMMSNFLQWKKSNPNVPEQSYDLNNPQNLPDLKKRRRICDSRAKRRGRSRASVLGSDPTQSVTQLLCEERGIVKFKRKFKPNRPHFFITQVSEQFSQEFRI
jgi:hypothetical protein